MFEYDKLVGSIYDCAANPELWPETLGQIRDAVNGAYALVGFIDRSELSHGRKPFVVRRNSSWDEDWLVRLETVLSKLPEGGGLLGGSVDVSWTQLSILKESEFHKTDFFRLWVQPQGLRDTINTQYVRRDWISGMLSIPSYATRDPYGDAEARLTEQLTPHVRRAMIINDMTDKGKLALALYRHVLDQLSVAVFIIGPGRRLIFTNASGDQLLSRGNFLLKGGSTLQARRVAGDATALEDAIDRAAKGDSAIGISGIGVPLIGRDGDRAAAYVLPIAGKDLRGAMGLGHCAVFVAQRAEQQPMLMEILRTMFDLTPAEARVAALIAKGDGPQAIAEALGISVNTVRSHLQHIFAKTQTPDQTALGALVNGLMPPVG
jgi:DNA-binding CsgD family transcriptional regulator